jgi:4-amino-4-deoxy-L-arabinose transferase-like glycosyltransferase
VRWPALGVPDLGQAEHQKLIAVASWRAGDLIVDGEHPALFKGLVFLSTEAAGATAAALRAPSVLAGAVSCALVALIGFRRYGRVAGWTAGGLMAFGTISVGIDRVGKEDAVMVALALAGILCWLRAGEDARWWMGAAAFAGAAVAVKYEALPLLPALWVAGRAGLGPPPPAGLRAAASLTALFLAVHLAVNPLLLSPAQWAFLADFTTSLLDHRPPGDRFDRADAGLRPPPARSTRSSRSGTTRSTSGSRRQPAWVALVAAGVVLATARRRREDVLLLAWAGAYVLAISVVPFGFARYLAPRPSRPRVARRGRRRLGARTGRRGVRRRRSRPSRSP